MFRPSKPLLIWPRPMPTIGKFKIHPPLPLDPRKSQQLLNLLTTSFRDQLDTAHGFRTDHDKATPKFRQPHKLRERRHSHPGSINRPTDLHLSSVLENPLLSGGPTWSSWQKDPLAVFDMAVSKGLMDLKLAKTFLIREKSRIIQSPVLSVRQGMKDSGAGLKVLKWLTASGMTNDNSFLKDGEFANILMDFIVAEELQEVAWKWIKREFDNLPYYATLSQSEKKHARRDIVRPLLSLIKAEASTTFKNLDSAYMCLSRAAGYLKGASRSKMMVVLGPPGNFLSHSTIIASPDRQPPSESAFDSFLSLIPVITQDTGFHFAHLYLRHPSRPSAAFALEYLRVFDNLSARPDLEQIRSQVPKPESLIDVGLKTAKFLLEKEEFDDAEWVMSYLQRNFPEQLGVEGRAAVKRVKAEASSLQQLEGLSFT